MMDLTRRLAGKTCIVTGSGGSIGRATCLRFAAEGANVVGCDIAADGAAETVRLVTERGGTIINGPMEVPGGDRVAAMMDPQGAGFAVHSKVPVPAAV